MWRWALVMSLWLPVRGAEPPLRILFLGNSYTYYNNLAGLVAGMARGRTVETRAVTRGGATLEGVYTQTDALAVLRGERWDVVVLQEQSTLGLSQFNGDQVVNDPAGFFTWARIWDAEIRARGARTVLYSPWARKGRGEQQAHIDWAYATIAKELGAEVLPVGAAFQRVSGVELYEEDGTHPSAAGTYLAACVAVEVLAGSGCEGAAAAIAGYPMENATARLRGERGWIVALGEETARRLQEAALAAVALPREPRERPEFAGEAAVVTRRTPAEWAGRWEGVTWVYGKRANVTLQLAVDGAACSGSWQVFSLDPPTQTVLPLERCRVSGDGLRFTVKPLFMTVETHEAWGDGQGLQGRVVLQSPSAYQRQAGTWTLQRGKQ
ncbi:MAG: SGNH/GDSL hydrolase family protein [Bryobacterales bacterium]|nr:SGNH/GDSL hydrolase family protein [Bryobacterales bacterium]